MELQRSMTYSVTPKYVSLLYQFTHYERNNAFGLVTGLVFGAAEFQSREGK